MRINEGFTTYSVVIIRTNICLYTYTLMYESQGVCEKQTVCILIQRMFYSFSIVIGT